LIYSLKKLVPAEAWSSKTEKAWLKAFSMVIDRMCDGIKQQELESSGSQNNQKGLLKI
jgi:hypothetical protein